MWVLFALLSAFFQGSGQAFSKKFQFKTNYLILTSTSYLINGSILLLASYMRGFPEIKANFLTAILISAFLSVVAAVCFYASIRLAHLSLVSPMLSLTPVFLIFNGYLILGEKPSVIGLLGIILVATGIFFVNVSKETRFSTVLHSMKKRKGVVLMFFVAFLFSISSAYDKMATLNSDFLFAPAMTTLLIGTTFTILALLKFRKEAPVMYRSGFTGSLIIGLA
ncbi:EamA family transporter [Patescibacteria group bacterium]|nr:EamA family transporter [Patescibacteria group bacterium]